MEFKGWFLTGKGGHIGCAESFNANIYGDLDSYNSQGCEQVHSLMEKVSKTLRMKSYNNFMIWMSVFFAVRNMINMDMIWTSNHVHVYHVKVFLTNKELCM